MYVLSIILYGFSLQHFKNALLFHPLKKLRKIQWRAIIWIIGTFHTSLAWGIKTIAGLIPIHLYLNKISSQQQLRTASLSSNYMINSVFENWHSKNISPHCLSLEALMPKQQLKVKSSIVDTNNHLNGIFSSFDSLYKELSPSFRQVDSFSDHF